MTQTFNDVACTVCGCVCDDISVETRDGRIVASERLCALGEPAFHGLPEAQNHVALVDEEPAPLAVGVKRAAEILSQSRAPLIYGLSQSSTPGQRLAVRLADRLGAVIDTTASTCHAPAVMAVQRVGESTATLGEVRNRSDLVIYWGSNPVESHPRHLERFVEATGQFVPEGRAGRKLVVVDTIHTKTTELADEFIQVDPGGDFELLWALRMLLQAKPLGVGGPSASGEPPTSVGGVSIAQLEAFAELLKSCRYGAVFFGIGIAQHGVPHANVEALLQLVTELNDHTRFIARRMRVPGDVSGADSVLSWQTGFPFGVNFARGYPRYNPGEYTANDLLERGEVDSALLVGSEAAARLSRAAREHLQRIPTVILDYPGVECPVSAAVQFTTAVYGIHASGTAYRMDEVPIPLRAVLESPLPGDEAVLNAILEQVDCSISDD